VTAVSGQLLGAQQMAMHSWHDAAVGDQMVGSHCLLGNWPGAVCFMQIVVCRLYAAGVTG
jgi:hypothetical protein